MREIHFPKKYVTLPNECIAVWKEKKGPYRQAAGPRERGGHFGIHFEGGYWSAHRLSYHLNCEEISRSPTSLKEGLICHTCDHPWCINPDHLYLGTSTQNRIDMFTRSPTVKGRMHSAKLGNQNRKGKPWTENARNKRLEIEPIRRAKFIASRWTEQRRREASKLMKGNSKGVRSK